MQLVLYVLFNSSVNSFCLRLGVNKAQKIIHVADIHFDVQCPLDVLVKLIQVDVCEILRGVVADR